MINASTSFTFPFIGNKRLKSHDSVWIVTDVRTFTTSLYPWSEPQRWYRAGALDLGSKHLVLAEWSTDDMRAILKAGMAAGIGAPPWSSPMSHGFLLTRFSHGGRDKGRFREEVSLVELNEDIRSFGPALRRHFEKNLDVVGNVHAGALRAVLDWATRENAIEAAALSFSDWFAAGDVKDIVGQDVNVTRTLARMVAERVLVTNGKTKKGRRYMATRPIVVDRSDWTD